MINFSRFTSAKRAEGGEPRPAPRGHIFARALQASAGLLLCSFGSYLGIQANIGLIPWDCLNMGLSRLTGFSYGSCSICISILIILIDLLLGERIGLGTLLDAVICGLAIDVFTALRLIPQQHAMLPSILIFIVGLFFLAFGQLVYMKTALCCGPRDSLLVGIGKRLRRWPIGAVNVLVFVSVLAVGWAMRGPVGIGTFLGAFGLGIAVQIVFHLFKFEPRDVRHESLLTMWGHA